MNGEKKDLRYSRTDRLLQEAFLELLKAKSVDRITIRDLTERARINRCTFYHHYQDIYDLLEQIEDGVMEHVLAAVILSVSVSISMKTGPYTAC